MSMKDRQVAVLGGSAGIGLETARLLASLGAQVTIGGRNPERLEAAVGQLGDQARAIAVDCEQTDSLRQFFAQAGPITDRTFEIRFFDPGVQAYAFTFG